MCQVLKELYRKVYNESFDYDNLDKRINVQKAVYLLENMGVHVGGYSFYWNKYGPYSLELDNDAHNCNKNQEKEVHFSELAEGGLQWVRNITQQKTAYECWQWMECIASMLYLKIIFRYKDSELIQELQTRKPHMDDEESNKKALSIVKEMCVGV